MTPQPQTHARRRPCDILRLVSGVRNSATHAGTPIKTLQLFFTDNLLEEIVVCTNKYIQALSQTYNRARDAMEVTLAELKAALGLLFLGGVMKVSHINLEDLWIADGTVIEYFLLKMGINKFRFILRFDDMTARNQQKQTNKLAAVRFLIDQFNDNCTQHYILSENVIIDEMLDAFRGRCSFRQYIPNKPAKYGLKIFKYGRNVTMDNWFMSIPLAQDLLHNYLLTVVGNF